MIKNDFTGNLMRILKSVGGTITIIWPLIYIDISKNTHYMRYYLYYLIFLFILGLVLLRSRRRV